MISKKIVVIDDEKDLCSLIKRYLESLNSSHQVFMAHSLADGIALIQGQMPDVLFIDNNLPDGLGWEHLDDIHNLVPNCRIVLISASQYLPADLGIRSYPVTLIEKPLRLNLLKDYL